MKEDEEEQKKDSWELINENVKEIHSLWNSYAPLAEKKGVDFETVTMFSSKLNELTHSSLAKNVRSSIVFSGELLKVLPSFYKLYKTKMPADLKKIKVLTYCTIIYSTNNFISEANMCAEDLQNTWSILKQNEEVQKLSKETISQIDYAIAQLKEVTIANDTPLVIIKGQVLLSIILEIDEKA